MNAYLITCNNDSCCETRVVDAHSCTEAIQKFNNYYDLEVTSVEKLPTSFATALS